MPTIVVKHSGSVQENALGLRKRERVWLLVASVVLLFGLWLTYLAKTDHFDEIRADLEEETKINLNDLPSSDQLLPFLAPHYKDPQDRRFVADQLARRIQSHHDNSRFGGKLPNVGYLNTITVSASEAASEGGDHFQERVATIKERFGGEQDSTQQWASQRLSLLLPGTFSRLKADFLVRSPGRFNKLLLLMSFLFFGLFWAIHVFWTFRKYPGDALLLPVVFMLAGISLLFMFSLPDPLRDRFLMVNVVQGTAIGGVMLAVISQISVQTWGYRLSYGSVKSFLWLGLATLASLALVTIGSGPAGSGAKVNLFGVQPMEAIKACLLVFMAGYFARNWQFLRELEQQEGVPNWMRRLHINVPRLAYALPIFIGVAVALVFFYFQRDLGPALVICTTFLVLYGVVRQRWLAVGLGFSALVGGFWLCYRYELVSTVVSRIEMMLSPWDNFAGGGEHLAHAFWALTTGGFWGQGLGEGSSLEIPAAHTDMILAVVGEELGLLGIIAVILLYAVLLQRGLAIALRSGSVFSFFLGAGIAVSTALQLVLITGGMLGLIPLSGVVSPLLSYGMAATIMHLVFVGILFSLSANPGQGDQQMVQQERFGNVTRALSYVVVAVLALLCVRAAYIQVWKANEWVIRPALVEQRGGERGYVYNPRVLQARSDVPMGNVFDRNGIPLATSDVSVLEPKVAELEALEVDMERVRSSLERRLYPFGAEAFYLLGDLNRRLKWGARNALYVENRHLSRLRGYDNLPEAVEEGDHSIIRYNYAALMPIVRYGLDHRRSRDLMQRNRDLYLTIDMRLQHRIFQVIHDYTRRTPVLQGRNIAVTVLDPSTGDVLASVSYPLPEGVYRNPNDPTYFDHAAYASKAPGSGFKLATAMAAFHVLGDEAAHWTTTVLAEDQFRRRTGPVGHMTMEKAIEASSNVYFARIADEEVGPNAMLEVIDQFGFTMRSDTLTRRQKLDRLRDLHNLEQAGFGQGELVGSPLQVTRLAATVANDGKLAPTGWLVEPDNPRKEAEPIISEKQANMLGAYMRRVITGPNGSAKDLRQLGVPVAGKTGTAEEAVYRNGRRRGIIHNAWFTGFAPYSEIPNDEPKIAVTVLVQGLEADLRAERLGGGKHAAPIAGAIFEEALDLEIIRVIRQ